MDQLLEDLHVARSEDEEKLIVRWAQGKNRVAGPILFY